MRARHGKKRRVDRFPRNRKTRFLERVHGERDIILLHAPLSHLIRGLVSGDLTIDKVQSLACIVLWARELECAPPLAKCVLRKCGTSSVATPFSKPPDLLRSRHTGLL
jgi:hypothetical protein